MITYKDTKHLFAYVKPGKEHYLGRRIAPMFAGAWTLVEEDGDGEQHLRVPAQMVQRWVEVRREGHPKARHPALLFSDNDYEVIVTDARVVLVSKRIRRDGFRLTGQIRLPWVRIVEFRPKQSFLYESELVLETKEEFYIDAFPSPEKGYFLHRFELTFDARFHPGELARMIAQRAARYVEATQDIQASPELALMREAAPLPDPAKGAYASYAMPLSFSFPKGMHSTGMG